MRNVWNVLFKGLAAVLPVWLTLYLIYWFVLTIERTLRPVILILLPDSLYLPGMGLVAGLGLLYFIGLAVNAWLVRNLLDIGERTLARIPLVKSVFGALKDFMDYFSRPRLGREREQVVMVSLAEARLLGILTGERVADLPGINLDEDIVAVYLPMSYQIGGYTLYLPRSRVERVDMSIEEALRHILTAGLSKAHGDGPAAQGQDTGGDGRTASG